MKSIVVSRVIRLATVGAAALSVGSVQAATSTSTTAATTSLESSATVHHTHRHAGTARKDAKDEKDAKDTKAIKLVKVSATTSAKDAKEATSLTSRKETTKDVKEGDVRPAHRDVDAPIPKPSSTPLPTLAASTTRALAMPVTADEGAKGVKERVAECLKPGRLKTGSKELDAEHGVEPRHTPVVAAMSVMRASTLPEASPGPCLRSAIDLVRGEGQEMLSLTKCDGSLAPLAVEGLSVLARAGQAAKPLAPLADLAKAPSDAELAPGIKRLDSRLVERLQSIVDHFAAPGATTKVQLIAANKPPSAGSFHAKGRALDFRIEGVKNEALVAFCKELPDTGCGYYPSYAPGGFVHLDVRNVGSGRVSWIDASKPGEAPAYVAEWPLGKRDADDGNLPGTAAHLERVLDKELDTLPAPEDHVGRTDLSVERESLRDWTKTVEAEDRAHLDRH